MSRDMILGLLRHVLTLLGGVLVARGYTDDATMQTVAGAVVTLGGAVWSMLDKRGR